MRNGGRDIKGILFKNWKIKAIADSPPDKEWLTRRRIKIDILGWLKCDESRFCFVHTDSGEHHVFKPRYQVGDVVYIKEVWRYFGGKEYEYLREPMCVIYRNDVLVNLDIYRWHNPRAMPAWAARYFIKILDVQACRTKEITPQDCEAEGIILVGAYEYGWNGTDRRYRTPMEAYFALYDSINGKGAHERNWDFRYSFIKVEKP